MTDLLLDTNAVVAYMNDDKSIEAVINQATAIYVSATVLGELYYGAEKCQHGVIRTSSK